jgi:hypothetical protein
MKRTTCITIALVALAVIAASIHSHNTAAATRQPQIRPTPRPELTLRWVSAVTLNKTTTVGGSVNGDITGTVHLLRSAVSNLTITLSTEGCLLDEAGILVATLPSTVITIPAGRDRATFRIQTLSSPNTLSAITCTVKARYGDEQAAANFTVEPLRMASFTIVPVAGIGPFTATGTIALNARPAANKTVTLTSSNPIVRFGTIGNAQANASVTFTSAGSQRTVQVVASAVTQPTTVTITATLGAQTLTRQITVRPVI